MNKSIKTIILALTLTACSSGKMKYDASGTFESTEVIVSSEAQGRLLEFDIEEGDTVIAGRPVGYIDSIQLYLKRRQLLASNRAVISQKADVGKQIAALQEQIIKQKRERDRFQTLYDNGAATSKQVDDLNAQLLVLQKQLQAALSTIDNGNHSMDAQSGAIIAQLAQLDDQLGKCTVSSPVCGTVLSKYVQKGEVMGFGKAMFKVANLDNMHIRAYFTSEQLQDIKLNQKVRVIADYGAGNTKDYEGVVTWIAHKAEFTPKNIQTRDERANLVYPVKIVIKQTEGLKIGMYGWIQL